MKKAALILVSILVCACNSSKEVENAQISIPNIQVEASKADLEKKGPLLLLNGQPFSGYLSEVNEAEGYTSTTGYYEGKKEGKAEQYYESGVKKEIRFYVNNRKHGKHQGWWPNGIIKFEISFENGLTQGESKEWFVDGSPYKNFHYDKGQEIGSQKMWTEDGSIRANYVVKNGHRYGLIGLKNCKSVENEEGSLAALTY